MSKQNDVVVELSKLMVRSLRELGHAGAEARERACQLAGQAWALLNEDHPEAAERMNGVLHFLTGPRFAGPAPVAFESVSAESVAGLHADGGTGPKSESAAGLRADDGTKSPSMAGVVVDGENTSAAESIADAFAVGGSSPDSEPVAGKSADGTDSTAVEAPAAGTHSATTKGAVDVVDSENHPWLPAPEPLKTPAEVSAYYTRIDALAKLGRDFDMEVRHLIPADRHTLIIHAFNQLQPGQGFMLVNDHDPKPLYYQFAFEYADRFTWDPIEEGPEVWRVRIGRR